MSQGIKFGLASLVLMLAAVVELVAESSHGGGRGKIPAESLGEVPPGEVHPYGLTDNDTFNSELLEIPKEHLNYLCLKAGSAASGVAACASVLQPVE